MSHIFVNIGVIMRISLFFSAVLLASAIANAGPKCEAAKAFLEEHKARLDEIVAASTDDAKKSLNEKISVLNAAVAADTDEDQCEALTKDLTQVVNNGDKGEDAVEKIPAATDDNAAPAEPEDDKPEDDKPEDEKPEDEKPAVAAAS